jgi:hypothetical protein
VVPRIEARSKHSRKRADDDEGDVTYINDANKVFNKKINRYYDKYTKEIRSVRFSFASPSGKVQLADMFLHLYACACLQSELRARNGSLDRGSSLPYRIALPLPCFFVNFYDDRCVSLLPACLFFFLSFCYQHFSTQRYACWSTSFSIPRLVRQSPRMRGEVPFALPTSTASFFQRITDSVAASPAASSGRPIFLTLLCPSRARHDPWPVTRGALY